MKKALSLILIIAIALIPIACGSDSSDDSDTSESIKLVPKKANLLGSLNIADLLADEEIAGFYDEMDKEDDDAQSIKESLEGVLGTSDVEEAILFVDLTDIPDTEELTENIGDDALMDMEIGWELGNDSYGGLIVIGNYQEDVVLSSIESEQEIVLATTSHKDYTIHYDEESAIAFLQDDVFVMGSLQAVKDVIDVKEGDQSSVSGDVLDKYNDLGDTLFKLVALIPLELMEENIEDNVDDDMMSLEATGLQEMESIALSVDKKGSAFPIALELCFSSKESADDFETSIALLLGLFGLRDITISLDGSCVDMSVDITRELIEGMMESFAESLMEEFDDSEFEFEFDDSEFDFEFDDSDFE
ncbi:MAG: hypothetical protein HQ553_10900 [Chloroflexi bacterium]|nr:hypothetical protein [Chloroflexota bacterium]